MAYINIPRVEKIGNYAFMTSVDNLSTLIIATETGKDVELGDWVFSPYINNPDLTVGSNVSGIHLENNTWTIPSSSEANMTCNFNSITVK